jgi:uncharacterized protein (DUF1330 family)
MTVYAVAQLKFTDRAAYGRHAARVRGLLGQFGGRALASDEQPEILEGRWDGTRSCFCLFQMRRPFVVFSVQPNIRRLPGIERRVRIPSCCWRTALTGRRLTDESNGQ